MGANSSESSFQGGKIIGKGDKSEAGAVGEANWISEVEGKKRSPRNREIGFVSFVRASVRASERSCVCTLESDPPPARLGELKMSSGTDFGVGVFGLKPQVCTGVSRHFPSTSLSAEGWSYRYNIHIGG